MNPFEAILLGIIQGLTEFLPISSTAHLTLAGKLFGLIDSRRPEEWTAFIAVMQLGTLGAVLVYFYKDLARIAVALAKDSWTSRSAAGFKGFSPDSWIGIYVLVGTIPIGIAGVFFSDIISGSFTKNTLVIIASLVTLAAFLWLAEKVATHKRPLERLNALDALIIGLAQVLALIPGSSRSGTTITAGLFLNLTREAAARFSFLLSIPSILASGLYELTTLDLTLHDQGFFNLAVATVVSGISGYVAIAWLLRYLMTHTTMVFVWYRFALGLLITLMLLTGFIQP